MGEKGRIARWLVLLALALGAIGCGEEASTVAGSDETTGEERLFPHIKGPSREFLVPGGDNLVQTFGEEASAAEREEASKVIHAWMKARVAEDWVTDCRYLSRKYKKALVWEDAYQVSEGKVKTCPQALEYFGDAASGTSGETLTGPIDSLRVKTPDETETEWQAFAQWHGPEKDWVLPLEREGGEWKVAIAGPIDRLK
ncbi:MAG: hypothetical protein M3Y75_07085 [Actinomycetota bacterium]|nr:hypothetical protein [Actinomycetota bacterium]